MSLLADSGADLLKRLGEAEGGWDFISEASISTDNKKLVIIRKPATICLNAQNNIYNNEYFLLCRWTFDKLWCFKLFPLFV